MALPTCRAATLNLSPLGDVRTVTRPHSLRSYTDLLSPVRLDVIDYYHLEDDRDGNPVFSLDVRPAVDDLEAVQERIGEWWKMKKASWFGAAGDASSSSSQPGVRVQEER